MVAHPFSRLAIFWLVLLSLSTLGTTKLKTARAEASGANLIAHEWGTFTSVVGRGGGALEWRPLSFESDLPSFVYSVDKGATWRGFRYPSKSTSVVTVRMETPVIYFYAKEEMSVSVKVRFLGGRITEWYPQARLASGSLDWGQLQVLPGARVNLPNDGRDNHYYPARETDAAPLMARNDAQTEHEKFLFYRGVGNFNLPLSVRVQRDKLLVKNSDAGITRAVLFESRGGKKGYLIRDVPQGETTLDRPALDNKIDNLRAEMKAMLISHGLYAKEADAMLNTWRDSWFEEGLRVFYILPRKTTDAILPMTIAPQPSELVRVLVGRTEIITPEMEKNVIEQVAKLDAPSESVRETALKEIKKYGRFTEPILLQAWEHTTEPQIRTRIEQLLTEMKQPGTRPS